MTKLSSVFILLFLMVASSGCVMMQQNIDQMSQSDFEITSRKVYLATKILCRSVVFEKNPELKDKVSEVMDVLDPDLENLVKEGLFFDKLLSQIEDPEVKELTELLLLEIKQYGIIPSPDIGVLISSERSAILLMEVAKAINDAAKE